MERFKISKIEKIKILELELEEDIKNNYYYKSKYHNISEFGFIKSENIGSRLCIDELNINGEVYTILSNPENSKNNNKKNKNKTENTNKNNTIIIFIKGIKLKEIIKKIGDKIDYKTRVKMVKEVASDLSSTM